MLGTWSTGKLPRSTLSLKLIGIPTARATLRAWRKSARSRITRTARTLEDRLTALDPRTARSRSRGCRWRWRRRSLVHRTRPGLRHNHLARLNYRCSRHYRSRFNHRLGLCLNHWRSSRRFCGRCGRRSCNRSRGGLNNRSNRSRSSNRRNRSSGRSNGSRFDGLGGRRLHLNRSFRLSHDSLNRRWSRRCGSLRNTRRRRNRRSYYNCTRRRSYRDSRTRRNGNSAPTRPGNHDRGRRWPHRNRWRSRRRGDNLRSLPRLRHNLARLRARSLRRRNNHTRRRHSWTNTSTHPRRSCARCRRTNHHGRRLRAGMRSGL